MEPIEIFDSINNKYIKVNVASEVANRCRTDVAFAQELFHSLLDQNVENESSVEVSTIKSEPAEYAEEFYLQENSERESWTRSETIKLIKIYQKNKHRLEDPSVKKLAWTMIANDLADKEVYKTPEKCKEKWKNLIRTYKMACDKPKTRRFQFFQIIHNVLNDKTVDVVSDSESEDDVKADFITASEVCDEVTEKENWSRLDTIKFLKAYQKHKKFKRECTKEKQFWYVVSKELAKSNIYKSYEKCATKWKNLYRTYKRNLDKNNTNPQRFRYFQEVDDLMNDIEIKEPELPKLLSITENGDSGLLESNTIEYTINETENANGEYNIVKNDYPVFWSGEQTIQLIDAYKKHVDKFKKGLPRHFVWAIIASELAKNGIEKDAEKCEGKWKSLKRSYRKYQMNKTGTTRFYFADAMEDVFNMENTDEDQENINEDQGNIDETQENINDDQRDIDEDDQENMESADELLEVSDTEGDENNGYEEIIIETESDQTELERRYSWTYDETVALIQAYTNHKNKKDSVWNDISAELKSQNFHKTPDGCAKKWKSLYNIYVTHKRLKTNPEKFPFYKEIDDVFKGERLDTTEMYDTIVQNEECKKCSEQAVLDKQTRHLDRMQMLKRKLDIEERKVVAFEEYLKYLKNNLKS